MNAVVETLDTPATGRIKSPAVAPQSGTLVTRYPGLRPNKSDAGSGNSTAGLRVTFVNRYFYPDLSATSQMLFDLARHLVKQGITVSVVCSQQLYDNPLAQLPSEELVQGIQVHRVRTTRFGRDRLVGRTVDYLSFYIGAISKLLDVTQGNDIVVAKTDPPLISMAAAVVARWRGAKLVNWLQDLFPEVAGHLGARLPGWLDRLLLRWRDGSLKMAHANVVIGTRMKDYLLQRHIDAGSIHLIENWADGDLIEPKPATASALRVTLGLQNKFVVGYSGNLGRAHEYETILNAALALRQEHDVVFLMIGGGAKMQRLKQAVAQHQLNNFIFQCYQPRELLADSMAAADVHLTSLLPALEGLIVPSKFYGILAAGRPAIVIGDTDGELARIVRRERCGEAVAVYDWDALVSTIWHMKLDSAYRQQLGTRARTVFLERYTVERGVKQWLLMLVSVKNAQSAAAVIPAATAAAV